MDTNVVVALKVARVLEQLDIPYVIGGSLASTIHGEPRATLDVDFAVQLRPHHAEELVAAFGDEFYVDATALREAAEHRSTCNLVHLPSVVKVDLHVRPDAGIFAEELRRALRLRLGEDPPEFARVATAEDTIVQKLRWYDREGGVSDRQWRDVQGVLKAMNQRLDLDYLQRWATELGLSDLLTRAFSEAGLQL